MVPIRLVRPYSTDGWHQLGLATSTDGWHQFALTGGTSLHSPPSARSPRIGMTGGADLEIRLQLTGGTSWDARSTDGWPRFGPVTVSQTHLPGSPSLVHLAGSSGGWHQFGRPAWTDGWYRFRGPIQSQGWHQPEVRPRSTGGWHQFAGGWHQFAREVNWRVAPICMGGTSLHSARI